eukprot:1003453-Pyramimonas_sp.AAC.1
MCVCCVHLFLHTGRLDVQTTDLVGSCATDLIGSRAVHGDRAGRRGYGEGGEAARAEGGRKGGLDGVLHIIGRNIAPARHHQHVLPPPCGTSISGSAVKSRQTRHPTVM